MNEIDHVLAVAVDKLSSTPVQENELFAAFGTVVGLELKGMKNHQSLLAKKIINDVLHMGNREQLTENHNIVKVVSSNEFMM